VPAVHVCKSWHQELSKFVDVSVVRQQVISFTYTYIYLSIYTYTYSRCILAVLDMLINFFIYISIFIAMYCLYLIAHGTNLKSGFDSNGSCFGTDIQVETSLLLSLKHMYIYIYII